MVGYVISMLCARCLPAPTSHSCPKHDHAADPKSISAFCWPATAVCHWLEKKKADEWSMLHRLMFGVRGKVRAHAPLRSQCPMLCLCCANLPELFFSGVPPGLEHQHQEEHPAVLWVPGRPG